MNASSNTKLATYRNINYKDIIIGYKDVTMTQRPTATPTINIKRPDHDGFGDNDSSTNTAFVVGMSVGSVLLTCLIGVACCYWSTHSENNMIEPLV